MSFKVSESAHALNLQFHIPESSNAFSLGAARDLAKIQKSYLRLGKPVIVTSLHPRLFCSGGNLSDYQKLRAPAPGLKINREIAGVLKAFGAWSVPKLAIVDGDVYGGGLEWLAHFDYRWSTPHALFAFWQKRIGLSSGWGGGRVWSAKIGEDQLRRWLAEGRVLTAAEARDGGLVDRIITDWKLQPEAEAWAAHMHGSVTNALISWKPSREAAVFSSLWMKGEHAQVLKKWRR